MSSSLATTIGSSTGNVIRPARQRVFFNQSSRFWIIIRTYTENFISSSREYDKHRTTPPLTSDISSPCCVVDPNCHGQGQRALSHKRVPGLGIFFAPCPCPFLCPSKSLSAMLFGNALLFSALLTSVSAVSIHPLLAVRQDLGKCQNTCQPIVQKESDIQSGACSLDCICTNTFISALTSCLNCVEAEGQSLPGIPPNFAQQMQSSCAAAGYPVSGGSSSGGSSGLGGGSSSSSSGSSGLGGSGSSLGGGSSTATTSDGGLGLGGSSSSTASSSASTSKGGNSGGVTIGKSAGMGLSANMGVVAAVAAGVFVLIA